jgi:S1-C subfamily serine protease
MNLIQNLKKQKLISLSLMVFTLAAGIVIGTLVTGTVNAAKGQAVAPDATPLVVPPANSSPNEFTKLAKMVEPSVVNITTESTPKPQSARRRAPGLEAASSAVCRVAATWCREGRCRARRQDPDLSWTKTATS